MNKRFKSLVLTALLAMSLFFTTLALAYNEPPSSSAVVANGYAISREGRAAFTVQNGIYLGASGSIFLQSDAIVQPLEGGILSTEVTTRSYGGGVFVGYSYLISHLFLALETGFSFNGLRDGQYMQGGLSFNRSGVRSVLLVSLMPGIVLGGYGVLFARIAYANGNIYTEYSNDAFATTNRIGCRASGWLLGIGYILPITANFAFRSEFNHAEYAHVVFPLFAAPFRFDLTTNQFVSSIFYKFAF